jgi:hypothetical protein
VRSRTANMTTQEHARLVGITLSLLWRSQTMTTRATQSAVLVLPDPEHTDLERGWPPVSVCLAGTVMVMNVCATVLSLIA